MLVNPVADRLKNNTLVKGNLIAELDTNQMRNNNHVTKKYLFEFGNRSP
jgi:hypothetical protein